MNRYRNANTSLFDHIRKEQTERTRKVWLNTTLANLAVELENVTAALHAIHLPELYATGNASLERVVSINRTVAERGHLVKEANNSLLELTSQRVELERENGLDALRQSLNESKESLLAHSTVHIRLTTQRDSLRTEVTAMEADGRACVDVESCQAQLGQLKNEIDASDSGKVTRALKKELARAEAELKAFSRDNAAALRIAETAKDSIGELEMQLASWADRTAQLESSLVVLRDNQFGVDNDLWTTRIFISNLHARIALLEHSVAGHVACATAALPTLQADLHTAKESLRKRVADFNARKKEIRVSFASIGKKRGELARLEQSLITTDRGILAAELMEPIAAAVVIAESAALETEYSLIGGFVRTVINLFPSWMFSGRVKAVKSAYDAYVALEDTVTSAHTRMSSIRTEISVLTASMATETRLRDSRIKVSLVPMKTLMEFKLTELKQIGQRVLSLRHCAESQWRHDLVREELRLLEEELVTQRASLNAAVVASHMIANEIIEIQAELWQIHVHVVNLHEHKSRLIDGSQIIGGKQAALESLVNEKRNALTTATGIAEKRVGERTRIQAQIADLTKRCSRSDAGRLEGKRAELDDLQVMMASVATDMAFFQTRIGDTQNEIGSIELVDSRWRTLVARITETSALLESDLIAARNAAVAQQSACLADLRAARDATLRMESHQTALVKRRDTILEDVPKLDLELRDKDELIHNITAKQANLSGTLIELEPRIGDKESNFSGWNVTMTSVDGDMRRIVTALNASNASLITLTGGIPGYAAALAEFAARVQPVYINHSSELNETFYNLTFAQDSLVNSTLRIAELVDMFKESQKQYTEMEKRLAEYTARVDAGELERVDFKFEY